MIKTLEENMEYYVEPTTYNVLKLIQPLFNSLRILFEPTTYNVLK